MGTLRLGARKLEGTVSVVLAGTGMSVDDVRGVEVLPDGSGILVEQDNENVLFMPAAAAWRVRVYKPKTKRK